MKPLYEQEEKRQKKGDVNRSDKLNERVKDALKVINQFNSEETEEEGSGQRPDEQKKDAIYFAAQSIRLYAGTPKRVSVFVNPDKINSGEVVLFASDNSEIKVEPDSETVKSQKGKAHQQIALTVSCNVKEQKGTLTALTLNKNGEECHAALKVAGVDDPPVFQPPGDIEFSSSHFSGLPGSINKAVLLVNLDVFPGMPEVTFQLEEIVGSISLNNEGEIRAKIKVTKDQLIAGRNVARVPILFKGTGWGQHAVLSAKAKRSDGELAFAKCRIRFQRPAGNDKFSNFHYEDLDRNVLGEVAGDKIFINSGYALHRQIFGTTEDDFNKQLDSNPIAQMRAASVLVEAVVHHAATVKHQAGGAKGLHIDPDDPIGSFRIYFEESRIKLEPAVIRALAPEVGQFD